MWQYIILDFETGETVFTMDVSNRFGYNNMAIGMYAGNSGNALYCPTGYMELLRLQDRSSCCSGSPHWLAACSTPRKVPSTSWAASASRSP